MSRRERLKKEARAEQTQVEKEAIQARRQERLDPVIHFSKRLVAAFAVTVVLLVIGVIINNHLEQIAQYVQNH